MFVLRLTSALVLITSVFSAKYDCAPCECKIDYCNIIEADCSARTTEIQFDEIPEFTNSVEYLDLTGQQLERLKENVFENASLTGLKKLILKKCQISEIHKNAFANMRNLTYLDASINNVSQINNGTFFWTKNLKTLDLRNNTIQYLTFLQNLTELEALLLDNNNITYLDNNSFANNSKLDSLHLSNNKIGTLPDNLLNNLSNLEYLHISHNRLSRIPNNIFVHNSKLRVLLLEYNAIIEISPKIFDNLKNLFAVDLQHNNIRKIPENVFQNLTSLKFIILKNNEIETIPNNTFKNISKLHLLDLSYNKINSLSSGFVQNSSCLHKLNFSYVRILLNNNNISSLPEKVFRNTCNRLHIDLSYNQISSIDSRTFANAYVIELILSHNKISILSSNTFKTITKLDLSFNYLSILPTDIFITNNNNTYFDLTITNFHLDMSNNPINCDCKLKKQHKLFPRTKIIIQCLYPLSLKGKSWNILNSNQFVCEPEIRDNFTETKSGTTRQIGCKVHASPAPIIQWLKYNKTIQENDTTIVQTRTNETEDVYWYNLTFTKKAADFAGQYSCVLNTSAGMSIMNFTVLQQVQPAPIIEEESTHVAGGIWITVVVLVLVLIIVAFARKYRRRRQRNNSRTVNSETNLLYNPLDSDEI